MKTKKLRLHLAQYMNTVEMRVLEQEGISKSLNECVHIACSPYLYEEYICLRGKDIVRDNDICCITFFSEEEASEYLTKVIGWLDEVFYSKNEEIKKGDNVKKVKHSGYNADIKEYYGEINED